MRLTVRVLGLDLLDVEIYTAIEETEGAELAGGTLGSDRIEAGSGGLYMGFTNGLECGEGE